MWRLYRASPLSNLTLNQRALHIFVSVLLKYLVKLLNSQVFMPLYVLYTSSLCQISGSRATSCWPACSPPLGLSAPVAPQGRADSAAARRRTVTKTVKTMMVQPAAADISSTFAYHHHMCPYLYHP